MSRSARTQREVEDLEHRFQALVACSADAIFITDFDSARFIKVNTRAEELFGYAPGEMLGMTGRQLHPAEDQAIVDEISRALIRDGSVTRHAVRLQRRQGDFFWAQLRSSTYEAQGRKLYVTFVRDISGKLLREKELNHAYQALKNTEAQLVRSSRLAAIGQIAAGIAHEINNPAAAALMNLEVVEQDLQALSEEARLAERVDCPPQVVYDLLRHIDRDARPAVRDCIEAVQRIAAIVKSLRGFAQIREEEVQSIRLNEAVETALRLAHHQIRAHAKVHTDLLSTRELVADRGKLIQVFVNLLVNAAHALESVGGGTISIQTLDSADGVLARVVDDGPGVPADIAPHIFEPFFTTKESEQGAGLGLSLCADIVHRHRGRLELVPHEGKGACFELFLPLATGLERAAPRSTPAVSGHRGRILVVDDDAALVRSYRRWLGRHHDIIVAYDGEEALQVLEQDQDFDVILCDLMMPRVDGVSVFEELEARMPHLLSRLVFSSGGPTSGRYSDFAKSPRITFFDKPVARERLEQWIETRIHKRVSLEQRS